MPTVYATDNMHGAVMIKKVGARWGIYVLKEVQFKYARYDTTFGHKYKNVKWIFEKKPRETWGYKPYEDKDVSTNPNVLLDYVSRMAHHKMHYMPG